MKKPIGNAMMRALAAGIIMENVPWYRRQRHKYHRIFHIGRCTKPFQGEQECIRRRRQIEQGIIPKDQLYVVQI